jgi:hypothetical protein
LHPEPDQGRDSCDSEEVCVRLHDPKLPNRSHLTFCIRPEAQRVCSFVPGTRGRAIKRWKIYRFWGTPLDPGASGASQGGASAASMYIPQHPQRPSRERAAAAHPHLSDPATPGQTPERPQNSRTRGSPGPGPARPSRRRVSRVPSGRRDANPKPRTRDRARTERPSTECSTVLGPGALMTLGAPCADVARPPASARARARNTNAHPRPSHAMARPRKGALPQTRACDPLSAAPRWASALQP